MSPSLSPCRWRRSLRIRRQLQRVGVAFRPAAAGSAALEASQGRNFFHPGFWSVFFRDTARAGQPEVNALPFAGNWRVQRGLLEEISGRRIADAWYVLSRPNAKPKKAPLEFYNLGVEGWVHPCFQRVKPNICWRNFKDIVTSTPILADATDSAHEQIWSLNSTDSALNLNVNRDAAQMLCQES